jgi:hypothetical protein
MKTFRVTRKWGESGEQAMTVAAPTMESAIEDAKRYMKRNYLSGTVKEVVESFEVTVAYKH